MENVTLDGGRSPDCCPERNLLWFTTAVQSQVTENSDFHAKKKKKHLGWQSSMRRTKAVNRPTGVIVALIIGCLLAGVVSGLTGPLRPGPRPKPRTSAPPTTVGPTVIDFASTTVIPDYGSGSQDKAVAPNEFAAGTVHPQLPEATPAFDIPRSPSPTSKAPNHIYYDPTKSPTPAPTPLDTASKKTPSPSKSPTSATTASPASTKRPTTQPSSAITSTQPIIRTPVMPAVSTAPARTTKPTPEASSAPPSSSTPFITSTPTSTNGRPEQVLSTAPTTTANGTSEGASLRTAAPESATPQAITGSKITTAKSKWSLMIIVGSIATVAVVAALLIWRDTRRIRRRTCVSETLPAQSKNTSCELDFDWYPQSPSLTSAHQSVNTFMGRLPGRKESEAHVSSRAASTADLLNVSSVGDRSTRSDPSSRSEPIYEHCDEQQGSQSRSTNANSADDKPASRSDRTNSSPPVSFDDEVNALSDWEGSDYDRSRASSASSDIDTDTSVEMIFKQHRKAYLQAQGEGSPRDRTSNFLATWTSSLPRSYTTSAVGNTTYSSTDPGSEFKFSEEESKSDKDRDYIGSAYSAVPSGAAILEDYSIMMTSFHSDWSAPSAVDGEENGTRGSDRSIGSYDEEL